MRALTKPSGGQGNPGNSIPSNGTKWQLWSSNVADMMAKPNRFPCNKGRPLKSQTPNMRIVSHSPELPWEAEFKSKFPNQDKKVNGLSDPSDHIPNYRVAMCLQGTTDNIICRAFTMTLEKGTRSWSNDLPIGSIYFFHKHHHKFIQQFAARKCTKKSVASLFRVEGVPIKLLCNFLKRIDKEKLQIEEYSSNIFLAAFISGVGHTRLSIGQWKLTSLSDLLEWFE